MRHQVLLLVLVIQTVPSSSCFCKKKLRTFRDQFQSLNSNHLWQLVDFQRMGFGLQVVQFHLVTSKLEYKKVLK